MKIIKSRLREPGYGLEGLPKLKKRRSDSVRGTKRGLIPPMTAGLTPLNHWCLGRESNSYRDKPRGILSPLRLPIPPPRHVLKHPVKNRCFIPVPFTDNGDKCQEPITFFIRYRHHELQEGAGFRCYLQRMHDAVAFTGRTQQDG